MMYEVCKNVIMSGRDELSDMLRKLDILWLRGQLSEDRKKELEQLAREYADPAMSQNLSAEVDELRRRIEKLEKAAGGEAAGTYPAYIEGKRYRRGDQVSFEGAGYQCIAPEGQICTWSPGAYPAYWQAI